MNPALDLGYRLVALAASAYCARQLWYGLSERKIGFDDEDWLDWSRWANQIFYRDSMPIPYWTRVCGCAFASVLCLVGAIIGWQPTS